MFEAPLSNINWRKLAAYLTAGLVLVGMLGYNYAANVAMHRRTVEERAETVLDALQAGIRAQCRRGQYHNERLTSIFEELAKNRGIVALELRKETGELLAAGGNVARIPPAEARKTLIGGPVFAASTVVRFARGPGPGMGHGFRGGRGPFEEEGWVPLPENPCTLTAVVDASDMNAAIWKERRYGAGFILFTIMALAGLAYIDAIRGRSMVLSAALHRAEEESRHHQQMARMAAGLAHETKNPLGVVRGLAQSITGSPGAGPEVKRDASAIMDEADRTVRQINSFLALARPKDAVPVPLVLDAFMERFLPLLRAEAKLRAVTISYDPCGQTILADEDLLRRAVLNIVVNAVSACRGQGRVAIAATRTGNSMAIQIGDDGCGIAPDDLPHVTEPYFTRFEGGVGLGLTIVEQIASAHGWTLRIESDWEKGTQVSLEGITVAG